MDEHCLNCAIRLDPGIDEDPNGDMPTKCKRCQAEEEHDFDVAPGVGFDRRGCWIEGRDPSHPIRLANAERGLYFVEDNHIIYVPQGWSEDLGQVSDDNNSDWEFQCYHGGYGDVLAYKTRGEYLTTDAICWVTISELELLRQVEESEAKKIDPNLFELLAAIDSGEAV